MQIRLASTLQSDSVVDGTGIRTVIWTQGCSHGCPFCHNPVTHDFEGGFLKDVEDIKKEIDALKGQTGITLSGGDPLYQIEPSIEIAKYAHEKGLDVWCYSGFTYEEILKMKKGTELLENIDVLVDGLFKIEEKSLDLPFRGSKNQRIIDTKESLKKKKIVLKEELMKPKNIKPLYQKDSDIFI